MSVAPEQSAPEAATTTQPADETAPAADEAAPVVRSASIQPTEAVSEQPVHAEPLPVELVNKLAVLCHQGEWWSDEAISG